MFCTCRATVCSLTTSSVAISRFVFPVGDQAQHLQLTRAQPMRVGGRALNVRVDAGDVRRRAQLLEDGAGRTQLERGGVFVTERAAGKPDEDARQRNLVGRLELLPHLPRVTQRR